MGSIAGEKGISISYETLIKFAFQDKLWNSTELTPDGYTQMEANFLPVLGPGHPTLRGDFGLRRHPV